MSAVQNLVPQSFKRVIQQLLGLDKLYQKIGSLESQLYKIQNDDRLVKVEAAPPMSNNISIQVKKRPAAKDIFERHVEEMLWVGRWAYVRFLHLENLFSSIASDCDSILSFGCGFGKHEAALALKYSDIQVTGLDMFDTAIAESKRKFDHIQNVTYLCEDIFKHDKHYDFIYTIEVLEHIQDPEPFIERLTQMTDRVLIIVPNFLERYNNPEGRKLMWDRHEHYHIGFSKEDLSERLSRYGFETKIAKEIYFENSTTKVRELMVHLVTKYPQLVQNDMELLHHLKGLFDLDLRGDAWLADGEEGQGTFVYAERS